MGIQIFYDIFQIVFSFSLFLIWEAFFISNNYFFEFLISCLKGFF